MWYSGTATFSSGSVEVIGDANVDFVNNVFPGDACIGPNGLPVEILRAESRGKLILATAYNGQTTTGPFRVQPTQDYMRTLALGVTDLKNTYGGYRDTILQGAFPDGSAAAPGMRFIADQDTGIRRVASNVIALVTGGQDILTAGTYVGIGTGNPLHKLHVNNSNTDPTFALVGNNTSGIGIGIRGDGMPAILSFFSPGIAFGGGLGGGLTEYGRFDGSGNLGLGTTTPRGKLEAFRNVAGVSNIVISSSFSPASYVELNAGVNGVSNGGFDIRLGGVSRAVIDDAGNLLVGATSASNHVVARGTSEGDLIMQVQGKAHPGVAFFSAASGSANGAACAFALNKNSATGRSANAAGTINAAGADSAEYMVKAAGCGIIAKGDVCGVDRDGKLTKTWADAISFVVKSTDPHLVGGDTWAAHLPPRPVAPGAEPVAPIEPGAAPERDYAVALADWQAATDAYPAARATYEADHAAWVAAKTAYSRDLPAWEADLEAARQCVDRIAFCGQVPCNVTGNFEVGDYIVAVANGAGIKAIAMKLDDMTMAEYARRIGKVWAIREGRAWIDVQHG